MILITGAGGNVGREVLKAVVETGAQVRAGYVRGGLPTTGPYGEAADVGNP